MSESRLYDYKRVRTNGFEKLLATAIELSTKDNLIKLHKAYPELVESYCKDVQEYEGPIENVTLVKKNFTVYDRIKMLSELESEDLKVKLAIQELDSFIRGWQWVSHLRPMNQLNWFNPDTRTWEFYYIPRRTEFSCMTTKILLEKAGFIIPNDELEYKFEPDTFATPDDEIDINIVDMVKLDQFDRRAARSLITSLLIGDCHITLDGAIYEYTTCSKVPNAWQYKSVRDARIAGNKQAYIEHLRNKIYAYSYHEIKLFESLIPQTEVPKTKQDKLKHIIADKLKNCYEDIAEVLVCEDFIDTPNVLLDFDITLPEKLQKNLYRDVKFAVKESLLKFAEGIRVNYSSEEFKELVEDFDKEEE